MSAHKYWMLANITRRLEIDYSRVASEIRFIADDGSYSNNPANAYTNDAQNAGNAFDGDVNTLLHSTYGNKTATNGLDYKVWYLFDRVVEIVSVALQMRPDMQANWGQEWQTADVYYSDDGVTWIKYGYIEPRITAMDLSLKTTDVVLTVPCLVSGKSVQDDGKASRYVLINDWQTGDFIQKITPAADGSWSYTRQGNNPVLVTHVGEYGFKPQSDGGIIPIEI